MYKCNFAILRTNLIYHILVAKIVFIMNQPKGYSAPLQYISICNKRNNFSKNQK